MPSLGRWTLPGMLASGSQLTGPPDSSLPLSSFYFPITEKKEPCSQGEAERQASKIFGK